MHNLKEIFRSITPDNIKDIPVIKDSMEIFIELLEERSQQSIDLSTYIENKEIRRQLFKTYMGDLYDVLDGIKDNQKIIDLITKRNELYETSSEFEFISRKALDDMLDRITDEHFMAFKSFREKKGTIKGIEYIFHLIATLVNSPEGVDYVVIEGENPFELGIEGTLPPEFYYFLIAPLAHPAGFTYSYAQAVAWELLDYFFPIEIQYTVRQLVANCISIDPITGAQTKRSTDFSNRIVIDIKEESFTWPRSTKIYFGGEHLGEYLENLVYSNGDSTVELKNDNGILKKYGDFCTLVRVIESLVIQDSDFDKIVSTLIYPYDKTYYPEINDVFDSSVGYVQHKTPYLSWDKAPFFSVIGYDPFKFDSWNGRGYPDSGIITRITQETDKVYGSGLGVLNPETPLIGEGNIWGKHEFTIGQSLNEYISEDIPQRVNSAEIGTIPGKDILYGMDTLYDKETILTQPGRPRLDQAHISGDAFHMSYVSISTEIDGFIVRDDTKSYIVPDCYELENSKFVGTDVIDKQDNIAFHEESYNKTKSMSTDSDETIRVNSFVIQDNEYSFVLFIDNTSENITRPKSIQINPEWTLGNGLGKLAGEYQIGDELNIRVPKWNIPMLRDSHFEIGVFNRIGITRYDKKLDNFYGSEDPLIGSRINILGDFELIGGSNYNTLIPGFWNNGFHQLSDQFEFGVFRDGIWLPDNNVNQPTIVDVNDNYSLSLVNGTMKEVFGDNSDTISHHEEVSYTDDYEKSYTEELGEYRFFTENSDTLITNIGFSLPDNYQYSYEGDVFIGGNRPGGIGYILEDYFIGGNNTTRVFDENSDVISFSINPLMDNNYSKSFESTYFIGDELGVLNDYKQGLIGVRNIGEVLNKVVDAFTENSDMYYSFDTYDSDGNPIPNYTFRTKSLQLDNDYTQSFNRLLLIGNETIGDNLINPYLNDEAFSENSDYLGDIEII